MNVNIKDQNDDEIPFDFFEKLNAEYPTAEEFNLYWKCILFYDDIALVTFNNVKKFKLVLEDEHNEEPTPPPFAFPMLETFRLENIVYVTDEWINFISELETIRYLFISTMFEGEHDTMTDEVIAGIAKQSNFKYGLAFETFKNILTSDGVKNFVLNCQNLIKLSFNFTHDNVNRFSDLEISGWNIQGSAESLVFEKK